MNRIFGQVLKFEFFVLWNLIIWSFLINQIPYTYEIEIVVLNMPKEFMIKLDKNEIFLLKIKSKDFYISVYDIYTFDISHSYDEKNYTNEVKIYGYVRQYSCFYDMFQIIICHSENFFYVTNNHMC